MTLSVVASGSVATTTFTTPTHSVGDLIVVFAYRGASTTAPGLGSGFTNLANGGGNTNSVRIGYRVATGTDATADPSGTWTNATHVHYTIYTSSLTGYTATPGAVSAITTGASSTTVTIPALTLQDTSGASWVHGAFGQKTVTSVGAMTGLTTVTTQGTNPLSRVLNTNAGVTSWPGTSGTSNTAAVFESVAVEIQESPPAALRSTSKLAGSSASSAAVPVPSGATTGDIAVIGLYLETAAAITAPSGFTNKADLSTNTTSQGRLAVYWKRLTGADSGTYSFSWTGSAWTAAVCGLWQGRATSGDPFDDFGTAESGSTVTTLNVSASPTAAGGAALGVWTNFSTSTSFTPPASYTEQQDDPAITLDTRENLPSGSTGNVTATASTTDFMKAFLGVLAAAASGFTGTVATTEAGDTSSASGVLGYSGTATTTEVGDTSSASGLVAGAITGSVAATEAADTSSASGVLGYTGTLARTQANQASTASGSLGSTGTVSVTQAAQTSTATGKLGYAGSLAATQAAQVSSASGINTPAGFAGSVAISQASQTASASGILGYAGTVSAVQSSQTATASGTNTPAGFSGSVAATQAAQTSAASGVLGYTGTVARTEAADTSSAAGILGYTGTVARTEAQDTSAASGLVGSGFLGSAAATQASETSTAAGKLGYAGTAAGAQASHTAAASGTVAAAPTGTVSATQAANVANATGKLGYVGTLIRTQASSTSSAAGVVFIPITGVLAEIQANQTASASGTNYGAIVIRPDEGSTTRPSTGRTPRPFAGVTERP